MSFLCSFLFTMVLASSLPIQSKVDLSLLNSVSLKEKCELQKSKEVDMSCIEEQLKGDGLGGWVHASVKDQFMIVFTWRRPGNFFVNIQLPMISKNPVLLQELANLKRHDRIFIKGSFVKGDAPIEHINVTELTVVEAYKGEEEPYEYDLTIPTKVLNNTSLIGKVHAIANGGAVLVVEVGDRVYPVFNKNPELAKNLFRNDKIKIDYFVRFDPIRPPHLELNTSARKPVEVLEKIADGHGDEITLKGALVMFPESPQIIFNVYALRTQDSDGIKRNYTLVNFSDFKIFEKLRDKLEKTWLQHAATARYDRNKYINPKIIIEAKGEKNLVAPNQANPQILIDSLKDIKISIQ